MKKNEKAALIYEQKCQDIRAMNGILWKFPIIVITITGGLWYGAETFNISAIIKSSIYAFAGLINFLFIFVLIRTRYIINNILKHTSRFEGYERSRGYITVIIFSLILLSAMLINIYASIDAYTSKGNYMKESCPFCYEIIKNRIIDENETTLAIKDDYPVTKDHTLIIPKRHCQDYFHMTKSEKQDAEKLLYKMKNKIQKKDTSVKGFNIGLNCGEVAGQTIPHAHIHLIPRRSGDIEDPRGGVRGVIPEKRIYFQASEKNLETEKIKPNTSKN